MILSGLSRALPLTGLSPAYKMGKTMAEAELIYETGWHAAEHDGQHAFRWMSREAELRFCQPEKRGEKILRLVAGHSFPPHKPKLKVSVGEKTIGEREIESSFSTYLFFLPEEAEFSLRLNLDRVFHAEGDNRDLGIMVRLAEVVFLEDLKEPVYGEGWYYWEKGELFPFRWMRKEARVILPPSWQGGYLTLPLASEYYNQKQVLTIFTAEEELARWPLLYQWNTYSLALPYLQTGEQKIQEIKRGVHAASKPEFFAETTFEPETKELAFSVAATPSDSKEVISHEIDHEIDNKISSAPAWLKEASSSTALVLTFQLNHLFPAHYHPEDRRELGIRVGPLSWHQDEGRHRDIVFFYQNAVKNYQEMMAGATKLTSFPVNLGIDLYARCNISPPCVYCLYQRMKLLEGEDREAVVDDRTLASYGPFFTAARNVVNCSFGEPLLHPRLEEILEFCASRGKIVELSTNGQAFTPRTIRALTGKPIYLYVSLDAATPETYAKIRNERFEEIIANLMKLKEERKRAQGLPKIFMVFMPMRVNQDELEEYFRVCQKIEADALVLRPLLYLEKPEIREERGGYLFDYEKELLTPQEVKAIIRRAEELSRQYKIPVANQFAFGTIPEPGSSRVLAEENSLGQSEKSEKKDKRIKE